MSFILARLVSGHVAPVAQKPVAAEAEFNRGALLVMDEDGAWAECEEDPEAIGAIAESSYGPDTSGFNKLAKKEFPPGYMQGTKVQGEVQFHAEYLGDLPAADGGSYGVTRDEDADWKVDFDKTGEDARVKLVGRWTDAPINRSRVMVSFLAANVQVV